MIDLNVTAIDPNPCRIGGSCMITYDNTPLRPFLTKGQPTVITLSFRIGAVQVTNGMFGLVGLVQFDIPDNLRSGLYGIEVIVRVQLGEMIEEFRLNYIGLNIEGTDHHDVRLSGVRPVMLRIPEVKEIRGFRFTFSGDNLNRVHSVATLSGPATGGMIVQFQIIEKSISQLLVLAILTDPVLNALKQGYIRFKFIVEDGTEIISSNYVILNNY